MKILVVSAIAIIVLFIGLGLGFNIFEGNALFEDEKDDFENTPRSKDWEAADSTISETDSSIDVFDLINDHEGNGVSVTSPIKRTTDNPSKSIDAPISRTQFPVYDSFSRDLPLGEIGSPERGGEYRLSGRGHKHALLSNGRLSVEFPGAIYLAQESKGLKQIGATVKWEKLEGQNEASVILMLASSPEIGERLIHVLNTRNSLVVQVVTKGGAQALRTTKSLYRVIKPRGEMIKAEERYTFEISVDGAELTIVHPWCPNGKKIVSSIDVLEVVGDGAFAIWEIAPGKNTSAGYKVFFEEIWGK